MQPEPAPQQFLSYDKEDNTFRPSERPHDIYITLSNNKQYYERSAYTILTLLGDFGGFNDAIIFLISSFVSTYSTRMYLAEISSELATEAD